MFFKIALWFPTLALAFTLTTSNMRGWDREEVVFRFNPANCSVSSGAIEEAINHAVGLWNAVPSSKLRVTYGGQTSDTAASASPVIRCVTSGISGAVGVGIITTNSGVIQDGEIRLNSQSGDSGNIASTSEAQLKITLAHEMGHIFGLGHSTVEDALMYFSLGSKEHARLSQDDMDGMAWLYPRSEPGDGVLGCGTLNVNGEDGGPGSYGFLWVLALAGLFTFYANQKKFRKN